MIGSIGPLLVKTTDKDRPTDGGHRVGGMTEDDGIPDSAKCKFSFPHIYVQGPDHFRLPATAISGTHYTFITKEREAPRPTGLVGLRF